MPHFDVDTLYVYENVHSELFPLRDSFSYDLVSVQNPDPSVFFFNNQSRQLSYYGNMSRSSEELVIRLQKDQSVVDVKLTLQRKCARVSFKSCVAVADLQNGARACVLKSLPDLHVIDPSLFDQSRVEFCSTIPSFSYSLGEHQLLDSRNAHITASFSDSSRYIRRYASVSSLFHAPKRGIYSFTIMGDASVQVFLHHMTSPLFDIDSQGVYTHKVTLRLEAGYHRLVAFGFFSGAESFRLYWSCSKESVLMRTMSYDVLRVPAVSTEQHRFPRAVEGGMGEEMTFSYPSVYGDPMIIKVVNESACATVDRRNTLRLTAGNTTCETTLHAECSAGALADSTITLTPTLLREGLQVEALEVCAWREA